MKHSKGTVDSFSKNETSWQSIQPFSDTFNITGKQCNNATFLEKPPRDKRQEWKPFSFPNKKSAKQAAYNFVHHLFFWREGSSELSLTRKEQPYWNAFRKASLRLRKLPYDLLFGRVKGQPESCVRFTWFDGETTPHWWNSMPKCSFELFLVSLFAILL